MPINSRENNTIRQGLGKMKRNATVAVLIAVAILLLSMTMTAQSETVFAPFQNQIDTTQQFALSTPLVLGVSVQHYSELNQTTRAEIYSFVEDNPGIHFRGICDNLALSIGMVQYHAGILVSAGFLSVYSDGKMQRFFVAGKYSQRKMKIISLLRHRTRGDILRIITEKKAATHGELATQLAITSQGLTWQIHNLKKEGLIQETSNGLRLTYRITEADTATVSELINILKK
jgi:predicted transcriptional regulator